MPTKKSISVVLSILALISASLFIAEVSSSQLMIPIIERYEYDANGRIAAKIAPDGRKTAYQYNTLGFLTEIRYSDGWMRYGYDENSNLIWMKDKAGGAEYYYDAFDRLTGVIWKYCPSLKVVIYDYTPRGQVSYTAIVDLQTMDREPLYNDILKELKQDPSKTIRWIERENKFNKMLRQLKLEGHQKRERLFEYEVAYRYDILGNLISIDTKDGSIKYSYYPEKGQVERQLPNGIVTTFTYYPDGLLKSIRHKDDSGQLIGEYNYEYNAAGKVTKVDELTSAGENSTEYSWDRRGYLKELRLPHDETIRYDYDAMGNRISKKDAARELRYEYDALGRLIHADPKYRWDANGSLISETDGRDTTKIGYDGRNMPSVITTPRETIRYQWDGAGNVISKNSAANPIYYLPNIIAPPGFTLAEFDKAGRLTSSYLYGDVLIGRQNIGRETQFFLEDGFNSIRYIVRMNGKIAGHRDYTPFAEPIRPAGDTAGDFRIAGERFLPEIKKYLIGNRLYDPSVGRYLSPDPDQGYLERFDSFNRYTHGDPNPSNFMEPRCNQTNKNNNSASVDLEQIVVRKSSDVILREAANDYNQHWWLPKYLAGVPKDAKLALPNLLPGEIVPIHPPIWDNPADAFGGFFNNSLVPSQSIQPSLPSEPAIGEKEFRSPAWQGYMARPSLPPQVFPEQINVINGAQGFSGGLPMVQSGLDFLGQIWGRPIRVLEEFERKKQIIAREEYGKYVGKDIKELSPVTIPCVVSWNSITGKLVVEKELSGNRNNRTDPAAKVGRFKITLFGEPVEEDLNKKKYRGSQDKPFKGPDRPDNNGGDNIGGKGGNLSGGPACSKDPFKFVENKLGGIKLVATAEFTGDLGNIVGAVFDEEKQCLVLVGDRDISVPDLKPQDLAVALAAIFGPQPQDPQFSLDPDDPKDPRGKWLKAVYIPEQVISGTEFGKAMFEADWLLKQYSFGVSIDEDGKQHPKRSSVSGFKSVADLSLELKNDDYGKERWARFWIIVDKINDNTDYNVILKHSSDGKAFYFEPVKMRVKAKKQTIDPSSPTGLKDVDIYDDPTALRFADGFTDLYDEIARESEEFERIRQLAKAVALAKWLKKEGIAVDMDWVVKSVNRRIKTIDKITALSVQHERQSQKPYSQGNATGVLTTIERLYLFGGVDLSVVPRYDPDDKNGKALKLQEAVKLRLRQKNTDPIFTIQVEGASYKAAVLPVTKSGREIREKLPFAESDDIAYRFDDQKNVIKSTAKNGTIGEYEYDANGKLNLVKIKNDNGWVVTGRRNADNSLWTAASPKGNTLKYTYDRGGYLSKVEAGGVVWADYQFDPISRKRTTRYDNYAEIVTLDENSNVIEYEIQPVNDNAVSAPQTEKLALIYNAANNVTKVEDNGSLLVGVAYAEDNIRPLTITMPQSEIKYAYHPDGRIKEMVDLTGISASFAYNDGRLVNLQFNKDDTQAEYLFSKDGIVRSRDFLGNVTDYEYTTDGKLSSIKLDQYGEANYVYDGKGRLRRMRFPKGVWIEYKYESGGKTLKVVTHPSNDASLFEEKVEAKDEETDTSINEERIVKEKPANKSKKIILLVSISLLIFSATGIALSKLVKPWSEREGRPKDHDDDSLY